MSLWNNGWTIDVILSYDEVILIYEYDDSIYCDGLVEKILSVYRKVFCFSRYAAELLAEICESHGYLYIMYMNIMQAWIFEIKIWSMCISLWSIFIYEYMSIWIMKEYEQIRWDPLTWRQLLDPSLWR